jgi:hypothetical protein
VSIADSCDIDAHPTAVPLVDPEPVAPLEYELVVITESGHFVCVVIPKGQHGANHILAAVSATFDDRVLLHWGAHGVHQTPATAPQPRMKPTWATHTKHAARTEPM